MASLVRHLVSASLWALGSLAACHRHSAPPSQNREPRLEATDAGPPPRVDFDDEASPTADAEYRAALARAKGFAATFRWSELPKLEQSPEQPGIYGAIGDQPFPIEAVEIWVKQGEFGVRAQRGGLCRCLGPELSVRGKLERKSYVQPFGQNRGFFQVPRGNETNDTVPFVRTAGYHARSAAVLSIDDLHHDAAGRPDRASGRFVVTYTAQGAAPASWAAGRFIDAKVVAFTAPE